MTEENGKEEEMAKSYSFNVINTICKLLMNSYCVSIVFFFFFFFFFLKAVPMAYGSSQNRGPVGAAVPGLYHSHSNPVSEPRL